MILNSLKLPSGPTANVSELANATKASHYRATPQLCTALSPPHRLAPYTPLHHGCFLRQGSDGLRHRRREFGRRPSFHGRDSLRNLFTRCSLAPVPAYFTPTLHGTPQNKVFVVSKSFCPFCTKVRHKACGAGACFAFAVVTSPRLHLKRRRRPPSAP